MFFLAFFLKNDSNRKNIEKTDWESGKGLGREPKNDNTVKLLVVSKRSLGLSPTRTRMLLRVERLQSEGPSFLRNRCAAQLVGLLTLACLGEK